MKIKYLYLFVFSALLFSACEEDIQLDLSGNKKLVLLSNFQPNEIFTISLSTSIPVGSADSLTAHYPSDARIQLFKDGQYLSDFDHIPLPRNNQRPIYITDHRPEVGSTYSVKAQYKDYPEVNASSLLPKAPKMQTPEVVKWEEFIDPADSMFYSYFAQVKLPVDISSSTKTYYHLFVKQLVIQYEVVGTDTLKTYTEETLFSTLPNIDALALEFETGHLIQSNNLASSNGGILVEFNFGINRNFELNSPLFFELRQVTRDYYFFHKTREEQEAANFQQSILYNEPVLIHNNINGGLGHFSGYNATIKRLIW